MNINILKNLEHLKLFEYYYVYQDCILGTASLILIISLLIIIVLKLNYKNLWESVNRKIFFYEYSYAAEPPVQFRLSHLSRRSEPL